MGNTFLDTGEQTWEITVAPAGHNEANLAKVIDARAHFQAVGAQFPESFLTPLFAEGASLEATRVVICLSRVRDLAAGTMTVRSSVQFTTPEGAPGISISSLTEYGPKPETAESILADLKDSGAAVEEPANETAVPPPTVDAPADEQPRMERQM